MANGRHQKRRTVRGVAMIGRRRAHSAIVEDIVGIEVGDGLEQAHLLALEQRCRGHVVVLAGGCDDAVVQPFIMFERGVNLGVTGLLFAWVDQRCELGPRLIVFRHVLLEFGFDRGHLLGVRRHDMTRFGQTELLNQHGEVAGFGDAGQIIVSHFGGVAIDRRHPLQGESAGGDRDDQHQGESTGACRQSKDHVAVGFFASCQTTAAGPTRRDLPPPRLWVSESDTAPLRSHI